MRNCIIATLIVLLLTIPAFGDTIYIWTDKNGVKRFSDQPPADVEKFETVQGEKAGAQDENREGLQQMFNQVEQENREAEQRRAESEAERKAAAEHKAEAEKEARIKAQRDRLQQQIDALNKRGLSSTFTQGMRDNQIQELRKQIDAVK
ncbi:MAG: DUF4124 domain-containing protein [Desulfatitalea sp.]|nr:DUF4124 domain-containing protein [Desulfatitalea sp.]